ncbi:MAG: TetR family transcriptional regulator [Solirubrobacterales bacterium]
MAHEPHRNVADHIVSAALELAVDRGWRSLSLADIAAHAQVTLSDVVDTFGSKTGILDAYARGIDRKMLDGSFDPSEPLRDRLFDTVMRRFEAMAPDRRALAAILRDSGDDPWALLCGVRRFGKSMALTLEAAGLPSSGLAGLARVEALAVLVLYVLRVFLDDDSEDLARTMAALDKALRRAEGMAALVWRRRPEGQAAA